MKSLTPVLLLALGLITGSTAAPLEERDVQTVHLTFHGGPAEYSLAFPADGNVYATNSSIAISIIDAPDFLALTQCTFITSGEKTLASTITAQGLTQILVGPPQPITGVSCVGSCIYTYGDCYRNGQFLGQCCNGFCAANKCRPWVSPY
ncbi:hypothetical protein B0T17DRAFT_546031 [Bombardia bombarda]|uniref:SSCRP protein n=1 Tax=Bombardia bombarda TaxID=252184 RepID=A0AA39TGM9_9PEZI|nr:hypothetical protein B0T17DRAFT_546031 [Bombardia bombarda]